MALTDTTLVTAEVTGTIRVWDLALLVRQKILILLAKVNILSKPHLRISTIHLWSDSEMTVVVTSTKNATLRQLRRISCRDAHRKRLQFDPGMEGKEIEDEKEEEEKVVMDADTRGWSDKFYPRFFLCVCCSKDI